MIWFPWRYIIFFHVPFFYNFNGFDYNLSIFKLKLLKITIFSICLYSKQFLLKCCTAKVLYFLIKKYLAYKFFFINILILIVLRHFFKTKNFDFFIFKYNIYNLYSKIKEFISVDFFIQFLWYFVIYFILTSFCLYSLIPKINNILTIISIPIFISVFLFFVQNFMSIITNKEYWFFNFYPAKLIWYIAPLIILIEFISYFIRPLSLSIRIFANMLAGHILVHIISNYGFVFLFSCKLYFLYTTIIIILIFLNFIEYFIALIQPVIFICLSCIYLNDLLTTLYISDKKCLYLKDKVIS